MQSIPFRVKANTFFVAFFVCLFAHRDEIVQPLAIPYLHNLGLIQDDNTHPHTEQGFSETDSRLCEERS